MNDKEYRYSKQLLEIGSIIVEEDNEYKVKNILNTSDGFCYEVEIVPDEAKIPEKIGI